MTQQATDAASALEAADLGAEPLAARTRQFNTRGLSLRGFAARGMMVNTVFDVGLQLLSLLRGLLLAALLTRSDYGVWGVLAVSLGVLARIKVVGVGDKYMQQNDRDQELAFQQAFTMEAIVCGLTMIPLLAALPIVALAYGHWNVVAPGAALIMALPVAPFTASMWVFYRRMEFARARWLQALDPVIGFVVTVVLAIVGAGYWALVGGMLAGSLSTAIGCALACPYRFRWRYERGVMQLYRAYSMPLLVSSLASIVLANSASLAVNVKLGLAGVGVVALASNITSFSTNVDDIVSGTLYPALCAAQDRLDLLRESFEKANRLALMWAMPVGIGLALFCGDLIHYGLGDRWRSAVTLLQITGVVVAVSHIAFNWDDYLRARGHTKPVGVANVSSAVAFVLGGVPLTLAFGLRGLGAGIALQALVNLAFRAFYLRRLFAGFVFARHALRAMLMIAPAAAATLLLRWLTPGSAGLGLALLELGLFVALAAGTTWLMEGELLREAAGYILERRRTAVA